MLLNKLWQIIAGVAFVAFSIFQIFIFGKRKGAEKEQKKVLELNQKNLVTNENIVRQVRNSTNFDDSSEFLLRKQKNRSK